MLLSVGSRFLHSFICCSLVKLVIGVLFCVFLPAPQSSSHLQRSWSSSHGCTSPSSPTNTHTFSLCFHSLYHVFMLMCSYVCLTTGLSKICHMSGCSLDALKLDDATRRPNSSRFDTNMKTPLDTQETSYKKGSLYSVLFFKLYPGINLCLSNNMVVCPRIVFKCVQKTFRSSVVFIVFYLFIWESGEVVFE